MLQLMDGKGYVDEHGQAQFAYAHPLFWAPYTIIGEAAAGGRDRDSGNATTRLPIRCVF